ncbi:MAG: hypothetical protein PHU27_08890 [Salinivirgaceae bacterium]|nr:hypothetical protein [Salinivirgaceae bacterium]MDD4748009.1 hypothetical protein [Salinivirgaceae bacterium]
MENLEIKIEQLFEKATDYAKTSYELFRLKTLDKTADLASSLISKLIVYVLFASFMLFLNLGLAFWLGEILGKIYFGFFAIATFYIVVGLGFHFIFSKHFKKNIRHSIIKKILK